MDAAAQQLIDRRRIWQDKYAIRACYRGWYERMRPFIGPGRSVEVGAGSGDFPSFWPGLLTTDIVPVPWLDFVADGMKLPVAGGSLGNLVVIDLLHHLRDPHDFFKEASRVLQPGGRVLGIEPYITPVSWLGYRLMHHEDIWFRSYQKPQGEKSQASVAGEPREPVGWHGLAQARVSGPRQAMGESKEDPWQGNLALPNILFGRERGAWPSRHPDLRIVRACKFGLFDFQLAGGFKPYAFIGRRRLYDAFHRLDRMLDPLGSLCGFRIFVVIEKTAS